MCQVRSVYSNRPPQLLIHSNIHTNLNAIREFNPTLPSYTTCMLHSSIPHCRLKDCLQSYSPDCYDSNIQDLEERLNDFPEDVLVEHAVHMWHITVRHHHDLLQSSSSVRY